MSELLYELLSPESLSFARGISVQELADLLADPSTPMHYRIFSIPKKNGKRRWIEEPSGVLKLTQRAVMRYMQHHITLHPAAYGLNERDVVRNARQHIGREIVVKMDIHKFFPWTDINKYRCGMLSIIQNNLVTPEAIPVLTQLERLCFIDDCGRLRLPTGAPTSPYVSAIAFTPADFKLANYAQTNDLVYTRYIDDLTFSGDKYPAGLQKDVRSIVEETGYLVNQKKTERLYSHNHAQVVTGVLVNGQGIPKRYRKNLRAELDHRARQHQDLDDVLKGKLAFVAQVNKEMADSFHNYFDYRVEHWQNLLRQ